jgi:gamma-butyrobetaine dioxygenase
MDRAEPADGHHDAYPDGPVGVIAGLFASEGAAEYLGEPVTQAAHMLQAAALAEQDGAPPALVAAALLHVAAKRYLCATEPGYAATLSPASVYTLGVQGGPMQGAELEEFTASPYAADAVRVRRWDDQAKDPQAGAPEFTHFRPLLSGLLR